MYYSFQIKYRPVFVFHDICQINCKLNNNEKQQDVFKILLLYIHFPGFAKDPTKSSYYSTAENLKKHQEINGFFEGLRKRIESFESYADLACEFVNRKATFHKSCISMYDKQKLNRKRKRNEAEESSGEAEESNDRQHTTRRSLSAKNFTDKCFFCDTAKVNEELHTCQTLYLDMRIRNIAQEMNNAKLLIKLSEGDMVATEAKYHRGCLIMLYNSYRKHNYNKMEEREVQMLEGIALSEVVEFVEESILVSDKDTTPVFKLKDLTELYQNRLRMYGAEEAANSVHATRLKNKILENVPGLCATRSGKFVLLTVDGDLGLALFNACNTSRTNNGFLLGKVAQLIRKDIFQHDSEFNGDLSRERQLDSVPKSLLHLMALIMEGRHVQEKTGDKSIQIAANMAQIVKFNTVKGRRKADIQNSRHSKKNEPPLPVYIGMLVHNKTRKKGLVNEFANQGFSITYNRLQEIQSAITTQLCKEYEKEGGVRPKQLHKETFTSAAIDNIDSNPSSNTAIKSFHGTSISVFQHPDTEILDQPFQLDKSIFPNKKINLPFSYTNILPSKGGKPEPTVTKTPTTFPSTNSVHSEAAEWLSKFTKPEQLLEERITFSGHFSAEVSCRTPNLIELLPLLQDSINSPAMVKHCMTVIKDLISSLNSNQDPVITADQPVYALGKQIQWLYPNDFGHVVWMMGPLHIEMAFINVIGDWLDGSGWCEVFNKANISTPGRVENFLKGSHVKRSRYAHQISLSALHGMAHGLFQQSGSSSFENWMQQLLVYRHRA